MELYSPRISRFLFAAGSRTLAFGRRLYGRLFLATAERFVNFLNSLRSALWRRQGFNKYHYVTGVDRYDD